MPSSPCAIREVSPVQCTTVGPAGVQRGLLQMLPPGPYSIGQSARRLVGLPASADEDVNLCNVFPPGSYQLVLEALRNEGSPSLLDFPVFPTLIRHGR